MNKKSRRQPFNILSLDGSGTRGVIQSVLAERLQKEYPFFLRDVDLLTGTSTGAVLAFYLAADKKIPTEIYTEPKKLLELLEADFKDLTLADLDKTVAIVAFDLDNDAENPDAVRWKPKVFHNCLGSRDADLHARIVDVAMYSMAFPSYKGYMDGAIVASNPAMVALAQSLDPRGPNKFLHQIALLSLGTGKVNNFVEGEKEAWTVDEILSIIFDGGVDLIHFQCKQLLKDHYRRINPKLGNKSKVSDFTAAAEEEDLTDTVEWLDRFWK